ncbi:disulfide bond formation protein B [Ahrensia kielensis]|uniref:disulfide bond formation protein B n=1 Tax=Ahrensia kielensis TaxID=76980 RepID=UPI00035F4A5F|nr:disulfide bond formation protein B [Ahrensia kielensis]
MLKDSAGRMQVLGSAFMAAALAAVVGTALAFEHIGGYIPCKLCLEQRIPYYVGVPIALVALVAALMKWPGIIARGALLLVGLLMVYSIYLGVFHSGVEWGWWPGPLDCSTSSTSGLTTDASDLLGAIDLQKPPSCDEAAARFLGLSFAGWNVIASVMLAAAALKAAFVKN